VSPNAVEIRGLRKSFPRFTLGPLDLTVPEGAIYGLVGPNGAGKTTTMDAIFGMGGKDAGSITVLGFDHLRDEVAMKRQVGYVSPDLTYQPWVRVGRAAQFVRGFYPTWDDAYCARLMQTFQLDARDRIQTLSTGAKAKLALLLALSWRPKLLVLDEPILGLDAISKQSVFAELLAAAGEGRTVLISSHGLTDLERFADHVGMIKQGRLLFEGTTTDVVERYRMVDLVAPESVELSGRRGVFVQQHDGRRWRLLLDLSQAPIDGLRDLGATLAGDAPVTLEELFVALGRD
jgi:ABC-type multidrug transport system ATPase subunit